MIKAGTRAACVATAKANMWWLAANNMRNYPHQHWWKAKVNLDQETKIKLIFSRTTGSDDNKLFMNERLLLKEG